jgi:amino acid transporter
LGFIGSTVELNEATAPLVNLANYNSVGFFGPIISLGALFSFWSSFLACTNAGARILYSMSEFGIITKYVGKVHGRHKTPYVSITVVSILAAIIPIILIAFKSGLFDIYGWVGTIATYGFLLEYALVTIAVPVYLYKLKQLKIKNAILSAVTFLILLIPIVGSIYPLPASPYGYFPFVFLGWLVIGGIWFAIKRFKNQNLSLNILKTVKEINNQSEDGNERTLQENRG